VRVAGRAVAPIAEKYYVLLNKPAGYTVTKRDPHAKKTVMDLLRHLPYAHLLNPVGRLDRDTSGLLLLSNDGDLAHRLTHPSFEVHKTYLATVARPPSPEQLRRLEAGVWLGGGMTAPAKARVVKQGKKHTVVEITLHEGRKRQVRVMFAAVGLPLLALRRVAFGPLRLGNLDTGRCRPLKQHEVKALRQVAFGGRPEYA